MNQVASAIAERVALSIEHAHPAPTKARIEALRNISVKRAVAAQLLMLKRAAMIGLSFVLFGLVLVMWGVIAI